jgi:hypothetical protein
MLEDVILEALKRGPGTAQDISDRVSHCVYATLKRLVAAERVIEEDFLGNAKTYALPAATSAEGG